MKNRRADPSVSQQQSGGKRKFKKIRRRAKGKKNKNNNPALASTSSQQSTPNRRFNGNKKKMNRPLKRLQPNFGQNNQQQRQTQVPKKIKKLIKSQPNFLDALKEYKNLRNMPKLPEPSTSRAENQENINKYQSVTVISDDELEDGEIIEDQVDHYASIVAESFSEIERSKKILDKKSPDLTSTNQPLFYVDKSPESTELTSVPLYNSRQDQNEPIEIDDSVVCVDSTMSDDSVIIIDDGTPQKNNNKLIKLSPIQKTKSAFEPVTVAQMKRRERRRERLNIYKQRRMFKTVLELESNGLLDNVQPVNMPSTSTPQPSTSAVVQQSPFYLPTPSIIKSREKRIILIDGSNVAMSFTASNVGKKAMVNDHKDFSAEALKKVILYFENKDFKVKAVVPEFRIRREKSSNHSLMIEMYEQGVLITTPSKSYDDLILLESAARLDAAVVSNDHFRDIRVTKKEFKDVIEKRQIRYNWVFGELILAEDPNGRAGPKLDDILYKST